MKKLGILLAAALLASCGEQSGTDGYKMEKQDYNLRRLTVDFVDYPSEKAFKDAAVAKGLDKDQVLAFSVISASTGKCEIHLVDPLLAYKPELIGHEVAHCRYGQFHS